jgi:putative zinc finger protein/anti-sigma-K factor RskA
VTGCDAHGELLGGYVLGALSDAETETMQRHLATCPACAREYAALAGLPALLDRIELAEVPPPLPPPSLEEAVLDRWTREHRRAAEAGARRRRSSATARGWGIVRSPAARVAAVAAAVLAIAAVALALLLPSDDSAYAHGSLAGTVGAGRFTVERVPTGTRVYLEANSLPRDAYEVWCVRTDGRWISGGSFRPNDAGRAEVTLTAAVDSGDYHTVIVTRGGAEGERGPEVLSGTLEY